MKTFEDFYLKKDYPNALKTLEKSGDLSPGLKHYNMGTVYAQMQQLPLARFHFLMAEKKGLNSKEVLKNERIVESKLELTKLEEPLTASDYFIKYSSMMSDGILTTISFIILVIGLWILRKKQNVKMIWFFLPAIIIPIALNFWIKSWSWAVVMGQIELHDGPSVIFGSRGELPPGVLVLTKNKGDWKEIIYPARFQGWVKNTGLLNLE